MSISRVLMPLMLQHWYELYTGTLSVSMQSAGNAGYGLIVLQLVATGSHFLGLLDSF